MDATAKPYLEKVQATTKPYTDAAAAKAKEVIEKIEVGRGEARRDEARRDETACSSSLTQSDSSVALRTLLLAG